MMKDVSETSASKEAVIAIILQIFWNKMMMQAHNQQKKKHLNRLTNGKNIAKLI